MGDMGQADGGSGASPRPRIGSFRLWPAEYDELRAEVQALLPQYADMIAQGAAPSVETGQPRDDQAEQEARLAENRARIAMFAQAVAEGEDREIAGVPCRVFLPDDAAAPPAVMVHFHGGGMVIGTAAMNDASNLARCRTHGVPVVSVDYRLAPEHPYPAAPDDAFAVTSWLLDHAGKSVADGGFGTKHLIVAGESAGAYLAALTLLRVRDQLGADALAQVLGAQLVFGIFDWSQTPSQRGQRASSGPDLLDPAGSSFYADAYLPGLTAEERRDPAISPLFADLHGLPPSMLAVGTADHLLDDTLLFATRLTAAGGDVELWVGPDLPHGFLAPLSCELARRWQQQSEAWLTTLLDR